MPDLNKIIFKLSEKLYTNRRVRITSQILSQIVLREYRSGNIKFVKEKSNDWAQLPQNKISNTILSPKNNTLKETFVKESDDIIFPIAFQCFYLSTKICEYNISPSYFQAVINSIAPYQLNSDIEMEICRIIDFNFNIVDLGEIYSQICLSIGISPRTKFDSILSDLRINNVYTVIKYDQKPIELIDPVDFCLSLLEIEELELYETIFAIEVDRSKISKIRKEMGI